jgi:hypothetical protein
MAGFSAEGIVEPLAYNLRPFVEAEGVIREPSSAQVREFIKGGQAEVRRIGGKLATPGADAAEADEGLGAGVAAVLEAMSFRAESLSPEALKRQAKMISALCSGQPSEADLLALPHRVMIAFAQWLSHEVLDPEAEAGATNGQVLSLPSAAAG